MVLPERVQRTKEKEILAERMQPAVDRPAEI